MYITAACVFSRGLNQDDVEQIFTKHDKDEDGKLNEEDVQKLQQELQHKTVSKIYNNYIIFVVHSFYYDCILVVCKT